MLWSRSASFTRITRISLDMASSIFRKFSAWLSSLVLKVYLADLGDAIDEIRHFRAEYGFQLLVGSQGILHRVMEEPGYHGSHVESQIRQYPGHFHGMDQVWFSGQTGLALMDFCAKDICLAD